MTTYDDVWTSFMENGQFAEIDLPKSDEKIYSTIQNAVKHFNNKMGTSYKCDNTTETLNVELTDSQLIILAYFIKIIFRKNQLSSFQSLYQPFQADMGFKNYSAQLNSIKASIEDDEETLRKLIMNTEEDYL